MKHVLFILVMVMLAGAGLSLASAESLEPAGRVAWQDSGKTVVDINRASLTELMELPGIGEKVAQRIVSYREENGPFRRTEELMNVRGIGEKTYLKLRSMLTVGESKS